jgi:putative oxidoreductase
MSYDAGLLTLRLIVGLLLAGHGAQKLFGWFGGAGFAKSAGNIERMGFRPGWLWAALATAGEFGGGLGLAVGLLMPLPAVGLVAAMLIPVFKVHWKSGLWAAKGGFEFPLTLLVVAATLGLVGPGRYSLDTLLGLHLPDTLVFWIGMALALITIGVGIGAGRRQATPDGTSQRAA